MSETSTPTSKTQPPTISAILKEIKGDLAVLDVPGTDYELHLVCPEGFDAAVGDKVTGTIRAKAQRIDVISAGGCFVEPVYGRLRRVQGRIIGGRVTDNEIYIKAGVAIAITPMAPQRAADFSVGQMVSFDVEPGALIEAIVPSA